MEVYTFNPNTQMAEAGRFLYIQGQNSQRYIVRPCPENPKRKKLLEDR